MDANSQFDGTFIKCAASDVRPWDVVFEPSTAQVTYVGRGTRFGETLITSAAAVIVRGDAEPVWLFRPANPAHTQACDQCDAEPGEPCDPVTCLGLAALEDAFREDQEQRAAARD